MMPFAMVPVSLTSHNEEVEPSTGWQVTSALAI